MVDAAAKLCQTMFAMYMLLEFALVGSDDDDDDHNAITYNVWFTYLFFASLLPVLTAVVVSSPGMEAAGLPVFSHHCGVTPLTGLILQLFPVPCNKK